MKPFVFLPGTLCDERLWYQQVTVFKKNHVVDLRSQDSLEAILNTVYRAPFDSFVLVGFSMGGYIAQEFTLRFPERVTQLVLLGASCEGYPPKEKEVVLKSLPFLEQGLFKGITDKRLREFLHPHSFQDPAIRELIHSMAGQDACDVYLRQLKATLDRRDLSKEIGKITSPLIAVGGKEDKIVPIESILRFEHYLPRTEVHVFPNCGHFIPLEQPEKLNELLFRLIT